MQRLREIGLVLPQHALDLGELVQPPLDGAVSCRCRRSGASRASVAGMADSSLDAPAAASCRAGRRNYHRSAAILVRRSRCARGERRRPALVSTDDHRHDWPRSTHERQGPQRLQGTRADPDAGDVTLPNGPRRRARDRPPPGRRRDVVAVDAAGRVCLLRQFRHAAGGWLTETPGRQARRRRAAARLRAARTGRGGRRNGARWDKLGDYLSSPGVLTEVIHVYLARNSRRRRRLPRSTRFSRYAGCRWPTPWPGRGRADPGRQDLVGLLWAGAALAAGPRPKCGTPVAFRDAQRSAVATL